MVRPNTESGLDKPNTDTSFNNIVIHVGPNDTRMRQSKVTKINIVKLCDFAIKMCLASVKSLWPSTSQG